MSNDEVERAWLAGDYNYSRLSAEALKALDCFRPQHAPCPAGCTNLTQLEALGLLALSGDGSYVPAPALLTAIAAEAEWDTRRLARTIGVGTRTWTAFLEDVADHRIRKAAEKAEAEQAAALVTPTVNTQPPIANATLQPAPTDDGSNNGTDAGVQPSVGDSIVTSLNAQSQAIQLMLSNMMSQNNNNAPATPTTGGSTSPTSATNTTAPGRLPYQTEIVASTLWQFWGEDDASAKGYLAPESLIREVENRRVRLSYTDRDCVNFFRSSMAGKAAQWFFGLWSSTRNYSNICIDDWEGLKRAFRSRYGYGDKMYHVDFKELIAPKGSENPTMYISRFRQGIDEFMQRFGKRIYQDAFPKRDNMLLSSAAPPANALKNAYFLFPTKTTDKLQEVMAFLLNSVEHGSPLAYANSLRRQTPLIMEMLETACITYATAFLDASVEDFLDEAKQRYEWWECVSFLHDNKLREWAYTYVRQNYEKPKAERPTNIEVWDSVQQKERSLKDPRVKPPVTQQTAVAALSEMSGNELRQLQQSLNLHINAASTGGKKKKGKDKKNRKGGGKPPTGFRPGGGGGRGKYCSHCNKTNHTSAECWTKNKHTSDGRLITDPPPSHLQTAAVTSEQYGGGDGDDRAQQRFSIDEMAAAGWMPPPLGQRR